MMIKNWVFFPTFPPLKIVNEYVNSPIIERTADFSRLILMHFPPSVLPYIIS